MRRSIMLALLGTVAVAGCGSRSLSDRQLHAQATQLCSRAGGQTARIAAPDSPAGSSEYLKRGIAVLQPELVGLRRLHPPSDVADVYANTVDMFSQKLSYLEGTVQRLDGGAEPIAAIRALQRKIGPLESQENGGWDALELPACISR